VEADPVAPSDFLTTVLSSAALEARKRVTGLGVAALANHIGTVNGEPKRKKGIRFASATTDMTTQDDGDDTLRPVKKARFNEP
jgi:hypothetical protein